MITRRTFLQGASVVAACLEAGQAQQVPNSSGSEPAKLKAPAGACDCHHHIYDAVRFPPVQPGGDIIPNARVEEFRLLQKRIGTTRDVVVTPRAYITDNRVTFDAIARLGGNARGVAVVHPTVTDAELKMLASGGDDTVIHVWDAVSGVQRRALAGHQAPIRTLAFSPDGQLLASAGEDTRIILWNTATGAISKILSGSAGVVNALVFDPRRVFLISATDTGEISLWNIAAGIRLFTFTIPI